MEKVQIKKEDIVVETIGKVVIMLSGDNYLVKMENGFNIPLTKENYDMMKKFAKNGEF